MSKRLGVNPRRIFVKENNRKRTRTACNSCNIRRVKCSGKQPCDACFAAQRLCDYPSTDKKVFVGKGEYEDLKASKSLLDKCLAEFLPDPEQRQSYLSQALQDTNASQVGSAQPSKDDEVHSGSSAASISTSARSPPCETAPRHHHHSRHGAHVPKLEQLDIGATEGSLLQDRDGNKRWLGGTSGATFLDHLKKFMHTLKSSLGYCGTNADTSPGLKFLASRGQYQTSDSQLLFTPASDRIDTTLSLESWEVAGSLLAKADEYLQSCGSTWACGGIYYFGDLSVQAWLAVQRDETRRREVAFYEAAFALGTIYSLTAASSRRDGQLGESFFAKARNILGDPTEIFLYSFRDVPALIMMAMYMAEMNRRDNAYIYLSYAITISCMFGGMKGSFNDERDKRIVWTLFCLDREYACLMGRPPLYSDEAFQLHLPDTTPILPLPSGLLAHIELSKIAGYLVTNTYSIAPRQAVDRCSNPFLNSLHMLQQWRERLPPDLRIPLEVQPEYQSQISTEDFPADVRQKFKEQLKDNTLPFDRALCVLHMKWNQAS
ncbi:hypothetical protein BD289DRAFT_11089 [Coniella lustricola]|uniref:Zn(2)-C6 fungal-type domain-containing protein n=1 Tax=Coniella lustricola TaxID=2025994 RepID=A0A2T3A4G0_9PEZI|nr:hypothetical protein BD289DRAFT_11089 [Coniella lustricola]